MKLETSTVAIVTGANRHNGVGLALVREFVRRGYGHVIGSYRDPESLPSATEDNSGESVPGTPSEIPRVKKFTLAQLSEKTSQRKGLQAMITLPPAKDWPREISYLVIIVGDQELEGTSVWPNRPSRRHYIALQPSMLPMVVIVKITVGESESEMWGTYNEDGLSLEIELPSPPPSKQRARLSLHFEPSEDNALNNHANEIYFDFDITVTQFLSMTAAQVAFVLFVGFVLSLILAGLALLT